MGHDSESSGKRLFGRGRLARLSVGATVLLLVTGCASYATYRPVIPQPVTVQQIVTISKQGVAPDEIINRLRASRTVYRLSASQLAQLHDQGVADKVIDYMQHTYLAAVRRSARFEDWHYWHHWGDDYWYGGEAFGWPSYWYWPDDDFFYAPMGGGREVHEGHGGHEGPH